MTNTGDRQDRSVLQRIAHRLMLERELVLAFPNQALAELDGIHGPVIRAQESTCDLHQLAVADVDAVVKKHSALDDHARQNTTSVGFGIEIFPILPEKPSTDLTSLTYESNRLVVTIPRPVMTTRCLSISAPPELSPFYGDSDYYQPGLPYHRHDLALGNPLNTNLPAVIIEQRSTPVVGHSYL